MFTTSLENLKTIQQQNDRAKLVRELDEAKENLILAEKLLKDTRDRWEFESIQGDIKALKWNIHELNIKIADRAEMSSIKRFDEATADSIVEVFNEEASQANQSYSEAVKDITKVIKQLDGLLDKNLPALMEIEHASMKVKELPMYLSAAHVKKLKSFEPQRIRNANFQVVTISKHLAAIQQLIKEMEGVR